MLYGIRLLEKIVQMISAQLCLIVNVKVGTNSVLASPIYIAVPAGAVVEKVDIKIGSEDVTAETYRLKANKTMKDGGYTYVKTSAFTKKEGKQLWPGGPFWGLWNVNNIAHLNTGRNSRHVGSYFTWGGVERHRLASSGYWKAGESGSEVRKGFTETNFKLTAAYTDLQGKDVPLGDTRYDVAALLYKKDTKYTGDKVEISGDWRLPTSEEIKKLVNNCHWVWATFDDGDGKDLAKYGCYIFVADASHPATGNGNAPSKNLSGLDISKGIFLPAAGYGKDDALESDGCALYWCADGPLNGTDWKNDPFKPRQLNFHSSKIQTYGDYKGKTGMLVRPASNGIHDVRVTEKDLVRVDKLLVAFQFRCQQMQHVRPVQSIKKFQAGIPCCIQRLAHLCHIRNERHVFRYYHQ